METDPLIEVCLCISVSISRINSVAGVLFCARLKGKQERRVIVHGPRIARRRRRESPFHPLTADTYGAEAWASDGISIHPHTRDSSFVRRSQLACQNIGRAGLDGTVPSCSDASVTKRAPCSLTSACYFPQCKGKNSPFVMSPGARRAFFLFSELKICEQPSCDIFYRV